MQHHQRLTLGANGAHTTRGIALADASTRAAGVWLIIDHAQFRIFGAFGVDQRRFGAFGDVAVAVDDVDANRRRIDEQTMTKMILDAGIERDAAVAGANDAVAAAADNHAVIAIEMNAR